MTLPLCVPDTLTLKHPPGGAVAVTGTVLYGSVKANANGVLVAPPFHDDGETDSGPGGVIVGVGVGVGAGVGVGLLGLCVAWHPGGVSTGLGDCDTGTPPLVVTHGTGVHVTLCALARCCLHPNNIAPNANATNRNRTGIARFKMLLPHRITAA